MTGIRRRLTGLTALVVALHVWGVTFGVVACCVSRTPHGDESAEFCPIVHQAGETCPMHAGKSESSDTQSASDEDGFRVGCGQPGSHSIVQSVGGGPLPSPLSIESTLVSTALPVDVPPQILDPGGRPFAPPPRG